MVVFQSCQPNRDRVIPVAAAAHTSSYPPEYSHNDPFMWRCQRASPLDGSVLCCFIACFFPIIHSFSIS